ncbi:hypothetical protein [Streptomyces sp. NBC_01439]|uniref:hypothetical protein n=1 Tax=Streptomyces sp. NBC_01439 TaxID=2903867 RepID=UPI002E2AC7F7|nr:hypothetical protein [Streptomyces sp. NBC_01439]
MQRSDRSAPESERARFGQIEELDHGRRVHVGRREGGGPAGPAGIDPWAGETVEHIVGAARDGDETCIRTLLADLAAVADMAALLYLRKRRTWGSDDGHRPR